MIEKLVKEIIIPSECHQQRLDSVLAQLLPSYSRSQISTWIKEGAIRVNAHLCKPKDKAIVGSSVTIEVQLIPAVTDFTLCQPEAIPLTVIYEDEELLLINKPAV